MELGETLEEAAERCGIHRNTAHRWRHRFLRQPQRTRSVISGIAEADETFVLRSAKGQPRLRRQWRCDPRTRGGRAERRDRSNEHVRVFVGRDRGGSTVERVYRRFNARRLGLLLEESLASDAIICTDGLGTYPPSPGISACGTSRCTPPGKVGCEASSHPELEQLPQPLEGLDAPLRRRLDPPPPELPGLVPHRERHRPTSCSIRCCRHEQQRTVKEPLYLDMGGGSISRINWNRGFLASKTARNQGVSAEKQPGGNWTEVGWGS